MDEFERRVGSSRSGRVSVVGSATNTTNVDLVRSRRGAGMDVVLTAPVETPPQAVKAHVDEHWEALAHLETRSLSTCNFETGGKR